MSRESELVFGDVACSPRTRVPASGAARHQAIAATPAAMAEIERLKAEHGPLMLVQSGGCCDGSAPMCFREGELLVGPHDLLLGEVDGCPFYVDAEQHNRWNQPAFVLDVAPGAGSGMSLEGMHDLHFRLASPAVACAAEAVGSA